MGLDNRKRISSPAIASTCRGIVAKINRTQREPILISTDENDTTVACCEIPRCNNDATGYFGMFARGSASARAGGLEPQDA